MNLSDDERLIFFGDSITASGADHPQGYVCLIESQIKARFPRAVVIGAGVPGDTVHDLMRRVVRDVLNRKPTLVVIYVGTNDAWQAGSSDVSTQDFKNGLLGLIKQVQEISARLVLCTPAVIGESRLNECDVQVDKHSEAIRELGFECGILVVDLRAAFLQYLEEHNTRNLMQGTLTNDGVHLSDRGDQLVASELLKVLGE